MPASKSRMSYTDCYELFDKALADNKGIRVRFANSGDASYYRIRLNRARQIDRTDNALTYKEDHPMCGRSEYDCIICRIIQEDGKVWLSLEKVDARVFEIESLEEVEGSKI